MGFVILNKNPSHEPKQVKYASVERFVEYAQALVGCEDYSNIEEFLKDAKEQWAEFIEYEEGVLTDEVVAAATPQLERCLKEIATSRNSATAADS